MQEKRKKPSEKSFVGLFWLNKDHTNIHEIVDLKSFDVDDISQGNNISPDSNHSDYIPIPTYLPRGRVMLIGGQLVMYVGLRCPDSAIDMILQHMGLLKYKEKIIFHRDAHWDMRNNTTIINSNDKIMEHINQDSNKKTFKQEFNWKRNIDEEINFREIKAGKIASGTLFRSSNPLKGGDLRQKKGLLAVNAGIKCILNLEDNDSVIEELSKDIPWYNKLYVEGNVIGLKMYLTIPSTDFNKKLKKGLQFMIARRGPYLIHCFAGIDRAGFVAAVLQALMGASMEEICNDYLLSFRTVDASPNMLLKQFAEINHGKPVYNKDLQIAAMNYLSKDIELTKDEIMRLIDVLGGKFKSRSLVCLFWLSDDHKNIIKTAGEVEIIHSDIIGKNTIEPRGMHDNYIKDSYKYNRGRVSLIGGKVDVSVGKKCPDETLDIIREYYGIEKYDFLLYKTGDYDKTV